MLKPGLIGTIGSKEFRQQLAHRELPGPGKLDELPVALEKEPASIGAELLAQKQRSMASASSA